MLKQNLHFWDRIMRGVIGVAVTGFALFNGDMLNDPLLEVLLGIFGVLNLISLGTGWCPVYALTGINTHSDSNKHS